MLSPTGGRQGHLSSPQRLNLPQQRQCWAQGTSRPAAGSQPTTPPQPQAPRTPPHARTVPPPVPPRRGASLAGRPNLGALRGVQLTRHWACPTSWAASGVTTQPGHVTHLCGDNWGSPRRTGCSEAPGPATPASVCVREPHPRGPRGPQVCAGHCRVPPAPRGSHQPGPAPGWPSQRRSDVSEHPERARRRAEAQAAARAASGGGRKGGAQGADPRGLQQPTRTSPPDQRSATSRQRLQAGHGGSVCPTESREKPQITPPAPRATGLPLSQPQLPPRCNKGVGIRPERSLPSPPAPLHPRDLLFLPSTGALFRPRFWASWTVRQHPRCWPRGCPWQTGSGAASLSLQLS